VDLFCRQKLNSLYYFQALEPVRESNCGPWPVTISKFFAKVIHYLEATPVIAIASSNAEMLG